MPAAFRTRALSPSRTSLHLPLAASKLSQPRALVIKLKLVRKRPVNPSSIAPAGCLRPRLTPGLAFGESPPPCPMAVSGQELSLPRALPCTYLSLHQSFRNPVHCCHAVELVRKRPVNPSSIAPAGCLRPRLTPGLAFGADKSSLSLAHFPALTSRCIKAFATPCIGHQAEERGGNGHGACCHAVELVRKRPVNPSSIAPAGCLRPRLTPGYFPALTSRCIKAFATPCIGHQAEERGGAT
jgi:hypothetical protein